MVCIILITFSSAEELLLARHEVPTKNPTGLSGARDKNITETEPNEANYKILDGTEPKYNWTGVRCRKCVQLRNRTREREKSELNQNQNHVVWVLDGSANS